jgi:diaminopimelate epimerase
MALPFVKMHGAGNDFVMLDARDLAGAAPLDAARIAALCHRRTGVGGDGLIVVGQEADGAVRMTYYNSDGGEAGMCGNGARCTVAFAHALGLLGQTGVLRTRAGDLAATVHGPQDIEVELTPFADLAHDLELPGAPPGRYHHCDTGVPHLVIPVDDIEAVDPAAAGPPLRFHARFVPAGVNVDWVARDPGGARWRLRTYERGVEAETLACGTGAAAAATVLVSLGLTSSPVAIATRGGDLLGVDVDLDRRRLRLRGPARVAFEGEVASDD